VLEHFLDRGIVLNHKDSGGGADSREKFGQP